jgi:hypothetical protein
MQNENGNVREKCGDEPEARMNILENEGGRCLGELLTNLRLTTDGAIILVLEKIPGDNQSGVSSSQAARNSGCEVDRIGRLALGLMSSASCPVLGPNNMVGGCMGLKKCTRMSAVVGNPSLTNQDSNCGHHKSGRLPEC